MEKIVFLILFFFIVGFLSEGITFFYWFLSVYFFGVSLTMVLLLSMA